MILVRVIFFFYRLRNFARGHDFDRSRDNHKIKSASLVAGTYTRRSAPVPTVVMVRALAVRCFVVPYFGKIYEFSALLSHCKISRRRECIDKTTCFNIFIMADVQFTGPHRHYWVVEMCSLASGVRRSLGQQQNDPTIVYHMQQVLRL